jgi:tetrahydromethanopterin S-methyltransferase subunit A
MSQAPLPIEGLPLRAALALDEIARGMELKKCRKCGCMKDALDQAGRAFQSAEEPEIRSLVSRIAVYQARIEPLAYDCIGCKKCWSSDASIELANNFEEVELDICENEDEHASDGIQSAIGSSNRSAHALSVAAWPPHPGDHMVGNPEGTVAICTLSNRDLPVRLIAAGEPAVAIAGRCDTENISIEKVVLNLLADPRIRWLVICGTEAKGHRAGDAFLRLKERDVDADMRVLASASWRRSRLLPWSRTGQSRGGSIKWYHIRAGCRPRDTCSGGIYPTEEVRLPMQ